MSTAHKAHAEQHMRAWLQAKRLQYEAEIAMGYRPAILELEAVTLLEERLRELDEQKKQINRYRRLLAICKESVSELLNDNEI